MKFSMLAVESWWEGPVSRGLATPQIGKKSTRWVIARTVELRHATNNLFAAFSSSNEMQMLATLQRDACPHSETGSPHHRVFRRSLLTQLALILPWLGRAGPGRAMVSRFVQSSNRLSLAEMHPLPSDFLVPNSASGVRQNVKCAIPQQ